jgi:antitoxin (DNA-binding transcriptional repressor) of toxin-antitoxin stability system
MPRKAAQIIDIKEAQANLKELIDALKPGEWFIISVKRSQK